jgi:hypothetical protein
MAATHRTDDLTTPTDRLAFLLWSEACRALAEHTGEGDGPPTPADWSERLAGFERDEFRERARAFLFQTSMVELLAGFPGPSEGDAIRRLRSIRDCAEALTTELDELIPS